MTAPNLPVVGILHPGRMGAAVAAQTRGRGARVLWCSTGRSASTAQRAAAAGLEEAEGLEHLLDQADVVLSICPPAAAEGVARGVAERGYTGIFVEANAISPGRTQRIMAMVGAACAHPVDAAIFGPPPTTTTPARLYLAGDLTDAAVVAGLFTGTALEPVVMTRPPAAASGLKMAYASYQKAARALAAVAHALASHHQVDEYLLAEAHRNATSHLADPAYLPSVAARAWRWAPEMLDVADALAAAGLPPQLAEATAEVMSRWRHDKDDWDISLADVLGHLTQPVVGMEAHQA